MNLKELPSSERPRERFLRYGAEALSSAELLAILLGSGREHRNALEIASSLIARWPSLHALFDASVEELSECIGIGEAKALQLKAAFALASRAASERARCSTYDDPARVAQEVLPELDAHRKEAAMVLLCDVKRKIIHREVIAVGTLTDVLLHPREVFYPAIRHKAHSLVLIHNHPSGSPAPSQQDIRMTGAIKTAGDVLGIALLDHLIVGRSGYFSFREKSLI